MSRRRRISFPSAAPEQKRRQRGLTLVETLVALAILASVVLAAYAMLGQTSRFAASEQERLIASIIADNETTKALVQPAPPQPGEEIIEVEAAGRAWTATRTVSDAGEKLLRIEIAVTRKDDAQTLARTETLREAR